ncbi:MULTISPECIES: serine hydrolase domain-containing protein [Aminobacterium]|jgi:CubicO group peptidase (beta-lactamase class C family)|uniref:serine hydrolase domain-containing protein n=1 Tax=Aminobacterium TaxID=81466 RepID=UPI00257EB6A3|nr:serine hydrolase domain-containing protein [Aminobacterium sp. UBA4834]
MTKACNQSILDQLVYSAATKRYIYGAVFYISSDDKRIDAISACGDMQEGSHYFIASINKLFVSSIILRLSATKILDLYDKISKYLSDEILRGLHIYKGKEYSYDLSILHLISQTSGLPCYLTDKQNNGGKVMKELEASIDQPWPVDKVIQRVREMKTHFSPGQRGCAKYTDTNHQILGLIIENITGEPIHVVLSKLFQELGLSQTYVYEESKSEKFVPIRYKTKIMHIPMFLNSTRNDIISTARDQMTFLKAFFNGYFFPKERLSELEKWNKIFFPFQYGIGIERFSLPRILSPFQPVPSMLGHCGSTGSVAFYIPNEKLYITGTTNQQAKPNIAFQTMIKIIQATKSLSLAKTA